jgi:LuxR family transcriptional regulator, maltose regulon positive regulatory protein
MTRSGDLLQTKLFPPRSTVSLVERDRLRRRLDPRDLPSVVVVSAPAGFGKSTLLAQSLLHETEGGGPAVAWLSLDSGDSDPASYWAYVLAALHTADADVGASARRLLESPGGAPITTVLTSLLNDLATRDTVIVLVLDDYHVVHDPDIHEAMAFLVDHLPPQLRLVIATRSDPPFPVARLRARGQLAEVRAADLRFTEEETAEYFEGMGLQLSHGEVSTLEGRTEGWAAALQLAALSMHGRDDVAGFIEGFAGDDRHVVDYLIEEVVHRQPEEVRDFLLRTSVLARMSGPLADAVTGRTDGRVMLETLDRDNLFLVPLDDQRRWYRYHHLFADMLQARLLDERPGEAAELHRRASAWHEQQGDTTAAIEHALSAGDTDRAAGLVETALPGMNRMRREAQVRRWMEALPEEAFDRRPVLANGYVGALMSTGEIRGVGPRLDLAERWVEAARAQPAGTLPEGLLVADPAGWRRLPGWVKIHRAGLSLMAGDVAATMEHGREAIARLDPGDDLGHGAATALMGLAAWRLGDLGAAEAAYTETIRRFELVGFVSDILGCAVTVADLQMTRGALREAERTYRDSLDLAARQPGGPLRGMPDMRVGLIMVDVERDDLRSAREHLRLAHELGDHFGLPKHPHRWRIAEARVREAEGDLPGALAMLDEAEQVYDLDFSPDVRPLAAMRARVWVRQGRPGPALAWAQERGLSVTDEPDYLHEFEHITLARALLAGPDVQAAMDLLDRLLLAADGGGRFGSVLEIEVLRALALHQLGNDDAAHVALARALELGEPEGYVRTFTDEPAVTTLLRRASGRRDSSAYVDRLLRAGDSRPAVPAPRSVDLVDPLSERELEVLRLLASELSGPDIARHLVVSLNTVRTHTKSIYAKLGVGSRRSAVRRAEDLGLLTR